MHSIICLGDSNTWGYDPRGGRYPSAVRWVDRLCAAGGYLVHNLGENGREIPHMPGAFKVLCRKLDALGPFDGICILLGSNDLLGGALPDETAARMTALLRRLDRYGARLLVTAPPRFCEGSWIPDRRLLARSAQLVEKLHSAAVAAGAAFADADAWSIPLCFDGVHFTEEGHRRFAEQMLPVWQTVFGGL